MKALIKITVAVLFFSFSLFAQQLSRTQKIEELRKLKTKIDQTRNELDQIQEDHQKIYEELSLISAEDEEEAKRVGAEAVRLYPDRVLDDLVDFPEGGSASDYSFDEIAGEYDSPSIEFKNGSLVSAAGNKNNIVFIAGIGGTLLETLNEKSPEFIAITKYELPTEIKDIKNEYEADGLTFKNKATVTAGNTYLLRAVAYGSGEGIFAVKVHRKDSDGSIIVFIKTIKILETPPTPQAVVTTNEKPSAAADYQIGQAVQNAMLQNGFNDVAVDASTVPMTLRGTVPKGKLAEVIQLAQEYNGGKPVRNEITEK